jgi:hypothetical protein
MLVTVELLLVAQGDHEGIDYRLKDARHSSGQLVQVAAPSWRGEITRVEEEATREISRIGTTASFRVPVVPISEILTGVGGRGQQNGGAPVPVPRRCVTS